MGLGIGRFFAPSTWFSWGPSEDEDSHEVSMQDTQPGSAESGQYHQHLLSDVTVSASGARVRIGTGNGLPCDTTLLGSFNLLLDLHSPLDEYIINEWLDIADLSRMDIAFCNHQMREPFLRLLRSRHLKPFQADQLLIPVQFAKYLDWLLSRSIQIKLLAADRQNWKTISESRYRPILQGIDILGVGSGSPGAPQTVFPLRTFDHCPNLSALIIIQVNAFSKLRGGQRLQNLTKLKALSVLQSSITCQHLVALLQHSPVIHCLMLNNCGLTLHGRYLSALSSICCRLKWLQLLQCDQMSDHTLQTFLSLCTSLEYLKLTRDSGILFMARNHHHPTISSSQDHEIEDIQGPRYLTSSALTALDLDGMRSMLDDEFLSLLRGSACSLTDLNLSMCRQLTDRSMCFIARHCPNLRSLLLSFTAITDRGLLELSTRCTSLHSLQLFGCPHITNIGIDSLTLLAPTLQYLSISECPRITEAGVISILPSLPKLETLCATQYEPSAKFTDEILSHVNLHSQSLKSLILTNLLLLTTPAVNAFIKRCGATLTNLNISKNAISITDSVLLGISTQCAALAVLDISGCVQVSDTSLHHIASPASSSLKQLQELYIQHLPLITVSGVVWVLRHAVAIRKIDCSGCREDISEDHWPPTVIQSPSGESGLLSGESGFGLVSRVWVKDQTLYRKVRPDTFQLSHLFM